MGIAVGQNKTESAHHIRQFPEVYKKHRLSKFAELFLDFEVYKKVL